MQSPLEKCKRCHGNLIREKDEGKWVYTCLMCGRTYPITTYLLRWYLQLIVS